MFTNDLTKISKKSLNFWFRCSKTSNMKRSHANINEVLQINVYRIKQMIFWFQKHIKIFKVYETRFWKFLFLCISISTNLFVWKSMFLIKYSNWFFVNQIKRSLTFRNLYFQKFHFCENKLRNSWQKIIDYNSFFQNIILLFAKNSSWYFDFYQSQKS